MKTYIIFILPPNNKYISGKIEFKNSLKLKISVFYIKIITKRHPNQLINFIYSNLLGYYYIKIPTTSYKAHVKIFNIGALTEEVKIN